MSFDSSFNLGIILNQPNLSLYCNIIYHSGFLYGGHEGTNTGNCFIYRINPLNPTINVTKLYNPKFFYVKAIAFDSSGNDLYCYSSNTPNKIYSIPRLFTSSSPITDIDISSGVILTANSNYYHLCITSTDFYIQSTGYSKLYKISRLTNQITRTTDVFNVVGLDINKATEKIYYMNNATKFLNSIDASGVSTPLRQLTGTNNLSSQLLFYNNIIYINYTNSSVNYLGLYNIELDTSFNSVVTNITGNPLLGMTINTSNNQMYARENDIIYIAAENTYCFNKGTKILCRNNEKNDEYIAIELLQIGDFVKTYEHGYLKIAKVISGTLINNPKKWNMCMYKMEKTPTNGLIEDLIVTGGHSLLVDKITDAEQKKYDEMGISEFSKLTIDNKHLLLACCSEKFSPMQDNELYTYYHLLLENNNDKEKRFGIWANGILTETPNEKTIK